MCGGAQIHVTDRERFRPVEVAVSILRTVRDQAGDRFEWLDPPYEYELEKMPIDILWGSDELRRGIDGGLGPDRITAGLSGELGAWQDDTAQYRLYD